ncbi:hypothetical protein H0H93_004273 [Arthromyces matolae]|nr:hypothetical protein H0H93_004273 [Arthromyces matolae]
MHIFKSKSCCQKWQDTLVAQWDKPPAKSLGHINSMSREPSPLENDDMAMDLDDYQPPPELEESAHGQHNYVENEENIPASHPCGRYVLEYTRPAGQWIRREKTSFESLLEYQSKHGIERWEPFANKEEWELAAWLMKHVGQKSTDEYLKLPIVRNAGNLSFHNNYTFLQKVDALPTGPDWECEIVHVDGDRVGEDGKMMSEDLELWMRNPVECIHELMGNPAFRELMAYVPERAYTDEACTERIYDEMWTGDWWWNTQDKLPEGATIAPIILSSDKTQLSQFRGDKKAWPLYLTIGNIGKETRRQPSAHATILVGYLPASKLECFLESTRSLAGYRLFHYCMSHILEPLIDAGRSGVEIVCADGYVRRVHPILAAYVADYPEQCLIACCMENRCPRCLVQPKDRGSPVESLLRNMDDTLRTLQEHRRGQEPPKFEKEGLRAIYRPFWHNLPHCNIFTCFTPDLLHQIHKGVFKDHFVKWCSSIMGEQEIDARFKAMADHPGLRHFKKGISFVSQWTGREHKEMEKVMMGVLVGGVNSRVLTVGRALLDFIFYAQYQFHTTQTLAALQSSLDTFHAHKDVFIELECREDFNIPKLHSMIHYVEAIRALGSADGCVSSKQ